MKKLEINDNNLKMYQEYLDIQNNNYNKVMSNIWFIFAIVLVVLPPLGAIPYAFLFEKLLLALSIKTSLMTPLIGTALYLVQLSVLTVFCGEKIIGNILEKIPKKIRMKKFVKKYPEFDKDLTEDEIISAIKSLDKKECSKVKEEQVNRTNTNDIYVNYQELEEQKKPKVKTKIYPKY